MRCSCLLSLPSEALASSDPGPSEAARCVIDPPRLDVFPRVSHGEESAGTETLGAENLRAYKR